MISKVRIVGIIGIPLSPPRWEIISGFFDKGQFNTSTFDSGDDLELMHVLQEVEYVVVGRRPLCSNHIKAAKKVRLIQVIGTQSNHIDLISAQEIGVPVAIMPLPHLSAVSEHAFMFMLALSHKLFRGHQETMEGKYLDFGLTPIETSEVQVAGNWTKIPGITALYGKDLGIVGMGEIGRFMARQGQGFRMRVSYFKRHRLPEAEEQELGIEFKEFDNLLRESDFVVPAIPHTPETERMFCKREFSLMKTSAFFVNCSRGGIVDQGALYEALKNKVIAGAGLDVYEKEPVPYEDPLLHLENVVLTPHTAGTIEELKRGCKMVYENILRIHRGEVPHNLIKL